MFESVILYSHTHPQHTVLLGLRGQDCKALLSLDFLTSCCFEARSLEVDYWRITSRSKHSGDMDDRGVFVTHSRGATLLLMQEAGICLNLRNALKAYLFVHPVCLPCPCWSTQIPSIHPIPLFIDDVRCGCGFQVKLLYAVSCKAFAI